MPHNRLVRRQRCHCCLVSRRWTGRRMMGVATVPLALVGLALVRGLLGRRLTTKVGARLASWILLRLRGHWWQRSRTTSSSSSRSWHWILRVSSVVWSCCRLTESTHRRNRGRCTTAGGTVHIVWRDTGRRLVVQRLRIDHRVGRMRWQLLLLWRWRCRERRRTWSRRRTVHTATLVPDIVERWSRGKRGKSVIT